MNKFVTVAAAGALALVASFSAVAPSSAHSLNGVGVAAGIFGFMAGAAAASAYENDRYYRDGYFGGPGWRDHVLACEDAYRSYSPRSDTYVGYDGYRHPCEL